MNRLMIATLERRQDFALLRLLGATRRQVLRMAAREALIVAGVGLVAGTVITTLATALEEWWRAASRSSRCPSIWR